MASLSLCTQFETNLMLNRQVIELLLQLKSAKAHDKSDIKVKPPLVRHLLRNRLLILIKIEVIHEDLQKLASLKCQTSSQKFASWLQQ